MPGFEQVAAPATRPVDIAALAEQLRVDAQVEQTVLQRCLSAACDRCERRTGIAVGSRQWKDYLDSFPRLRKPIELRRGPLTAVASITYYDTLNAEQTLDAAKYFADTKTRPPLILLAPTAAWPATYERPNAVTITYAAGHGDDIPTELALAILELASTYFECRLGTLAVPAHVGAVFEQYRMRFFRPPDEDPETALVSL